MHVPRLKLRVAVVQFCPKIGQVQANIRAARDLCRKISPNSVDLICFPEMAFTGYVFESASAIRPYLEIPREGPSSRFCSELAKELKCYVVAGYPEKLISSSGDAGINQEQNSVNVEQDSGRQDTSPVGYNSAVFYGPEGEWVGGYRKTNLFEVDKSWALPGTGFATFHLPQPLGTVSLGICMDLNPQPPTLWSLEDGPYELADHCLEHNSKLLILLNSWLDSGDRSDMAFGSDFQNVKYWSARLRPLWVKNSSTGSINRPSALLRGSSHRPTGSSGSSSGDEEGSDEDEDDIVVVICNRTGEENGKKFAGTSTMFRMTPGSGKPYLIDMMPREEEDVRIWTLQL